MVYEHGEASGTCQAERQLHPLSLPPGCDRFAPSFKVPGEASLPPAQRSHSWQWITEAASRDSLRNAAQSKQPLCCCTVCSQPMQLAPQQAGRLTAAASHFAVGPAGRVSDGEHQEEAWHLQHAYYAGKSKWFVVFLHISVSSWLIQAFSCRPRRLSTALRWLFSFGHLFSSSQVFPGRVFHIFFIPALTIFCGSWNTDEARSLYQLQPGC